MKKILILTLLCLAFPASTQAAAADPVYQEYCDNAGRCETTAPTDFMRTSGWSREALYRGPAGKLGSTRAEAGCGSPCAQLEGYRVTNEYKRSHPYGQNFYLTIEVTGRVGTLSENLQVLGTSFTEKPQDNIPWCPARGDGGIMLTGNGHPALYADTALRDSLCGPYGKAPAVETTQTLQAAPEPLAKAVACTAVKHKKLTAKIAARGTACFTARNTIAKYMRTGKAPGWQCLKLSVGRITKATCAPLARDKAQITASWRR